MIQDKTKKRKELFDRQEVGWHSSGLTYNYLYEVDMQYLDAYLVNNYIAMEKLFNKKYCKVKAFILKKANPEELEILENNKKIDFIKSKLRSSNTDFNQKINSIIVPDLVEAINEKMDVVEILMAKAGMTLFLSAIDRQLPASLGNDDFVIDSREDN